ncbi:MAG: response regulator [Lentisphaeraceae bacterium]|nr:response regulator [Lentisphaeraceae bacterium]
MNAITPPKLSIDSRLSELPVITDSFEETCHVPQIADFFHNHPDKFGVLLTRNGEFTNAISKSHFFNALNAPLRRELFSRRSVRRLCKLFPSSILQFESTKKISDVGRYLLEESTNDDTALLLHFTDNTMAMANPREVLLSYASIHQLMSQKLALSNQKAEEQIKFKSNFLATMSHEIRTPMNAILGFSELLKDKDLPVESCEFVQIIHSSTENLLNIINDILDISKIEAGKMELDKKPFSLRILACECLELFRAKTDKRNIELSFEYDPKLIELYKADEAKIRQILVNLLSNAEKFTQVGSINLAISFCHRENNRDTCRIVVEDTGIGMTEEQLHTVFDSFTQADASISRQYGGTGLGTTIVKSLVELMEGTLDIESISGRGTCFSIELPLERVVYQQKRQTINNLNRNYVKNILIVDDNKVNIMLLTAVLQTLGISTICASNGVDAIELAIKENPDLIIMDIQMPEMDGVTAMKHIKNLGFNKPIVALTANAMQEDIIAYTKEGMDAVLTKPFRRAEIIKELDRWF